MLHSFTRRRMGATIPAVVATGSIFARPRPAYAAYNCVNTVLRDPFWSQYRRAIESGSNAAGVPNALGRAGFVVDGTPSAGAVMSWPAGQYGASGVGHVGVVTGVNVNGSVNVLHENWPYGSPPHVQTFAVRPGMQFVHRPAPVVAGVTDAIPVAPAVTEVSPVDGPDGATGTA
ncbi:MAG TPA: CHAP domain-containing protein [Chloroflexota bacterium]|nr:CHAP domain-containing protein [Chloroflexota bacterium]